MERNSERKRCAAGSGPGTDWIHKKRHQTNCSSPAHEKLPLLLLKPYVLGKRTGFVFPLTFVLRNVNVVNAGVVLSSNLQI